MARATLLVDNQAPSTLRGRETKGGQKRKGRNEGWKREREKGRGRGGRERKGKRRKRERGRRGIEGIGVNLFGEY